MASILIVGNGVMGKSISRLLTQKKVSNSIIGGRDFLAKPKEFAEIVSNADIVLECLTENLDVKIQMLNAFSLINYQGIIGSCTSSLSINSLQKYSPSPSNFIGVHFMNPPTMIKLVEVVSGSITSSLTRERIVNWLTSIDSNPIELEDSPGFLVNSVLFVMLNQAAKFYSNSDLTPETIDASIKNVCGHKLGPLATLDLIGIDVSIKIIENLHSRDPESFPKPASILFELERKGLLGRKSGKGFYSYK